MSFLAPLAALRRPYRALSTNGIRTMTSRQIDARDFPDSPYARELHRHAAFLRFAPTLEVEYSISHLQRVRRRVKIWYALGLVVRSLLAIAQVRSTGLLSGAALIHLGAIMPCILFLLWLSWGRHYERLYLRVAPIVVPCFYALIARPGAPAFSPVTPRSSRRKRLCVCQRRAAPRCNRQPASCECIDCPAW